MEDLLITQADSGLPLRILEDAFSFLCGIPPDNFTVSVKWDGSPAFVCGPHPENGKFFLGTKSVFSGKVNYNHEDITKNHGEGGVADKLHNVFDEFSRLNWKYVTQGDLLWSELQALTAVKYNGQWYEQFKPNTLIYKFPYSMGLGEPLWEAWHGAVVHTTYHGKTLQEMEASFGASVPDNCRNEMVCMFEPSLQVPNKCILVNEQALNIMNAITQHELDSIKPMLDLLRIPKHLEIFQKYVNWNLNDDWQPNVAGFLLFCDKEHQKALAKLKTEKGKENRNKVFNAFLDSIVYDQLTGVFDIYNELAIIKEYLIEGFDKHEVNKNLVISLPDGTPCGHEGYVVSSLNTTCKFVDRSGFSYANLTTKKDW